MFERAILHIDMNNFYASVECMLNPELKPFPIAVCGSQEERYGIDVYKRQTLTFLVMLIPSRLNPKSTLQRLQAKSVNFRQRSGM